MSGVGGSARSHPGGRYGFLSGTPHRFSVRAVVRRRVYQPLRQLVTQGTSPPRVALCITLGALISVFPVLGTTTALCTLAAAALRLNLPAIQAVNWLFAGAQLVLLVPFMRIGERALNDPPLPLSAHELAALAREDVLLFLHDFWMSVIHAVVGWTLTAVPLAAFIYLFLLHALVRRRRLNRSPVRDHSSSRDLT